MKKDEMTSRERVLAAAKGLPVDRVPVMYWLNPHMAARLIAEYQPGKNEMWNEQAKRAWKVFKEGEPGMAEDMRNFQPFIVAPYASTDYVLELGADIADVNFGNFELWGYINFEDGQLRMRDAFGTVRGIGGIYMEVIEPGIKDINDMKNFELPDVSEDSYYDGIREFRASHPNACIDSVIFGVQEFPSTSLWTMPDFMMALIDYPDIVKEFQRKFADWSIEIARKCIEAGADVIMISDDYGYTNRPLISMDMWREFTLPQLKRQVAAVHEMGVPVMLHSCGYQMPFLEYYVEAEIDILQPFQLHAGNNFEEAYEKYGDRLTFATGIDIQLGESMTPEEMRDDILRSYKIGRSKNRHILAMTHLIQHTMPEENYRTIFDTVREIQAGQHDG